MIDNTREGSTRNAMKPYTPRPNIVPAPQHSTEEEFSFDIAPAENLEALCKTIETMKDVFVKDVADKDRIIAKCVRKIEEQIDAI